MTIDNGSTAVVPGWYPDPMNPSGERWWNGVQWAVDTRLPAPPVAAPAPPVTAPAPPVAAPVVPQIPVPPQIPTPASFGYQDTAAPAVSAAPLTAIPVPDFGVRTPTWGAESGASTTVWRGSPDTVGVWLLAFLPALNVVAQSIATFVLTFAAPQVSFPPILGYVLVVAVGWVFAALDSAALSRRGYPKPSILWMLLLPPLAYLIARGRAVRSAGGRAWPPELAYFCQIALSIIAAILVAVWASQYRF